MRAFLRGVCVRERGFSWGARDVITFEGTKGAEVNDAIINLRLIKRMDAECVCGRRFEKAVE